MHKCTVAKHTNTHLLPLFTGRNGQVLDVVHPHKLTCQMGAMRDCAMASGRDPSMWPEGAQAVAGDDVIHVFPKKLDPDAEVRESL